MTIPDSSGPSGTARVDGETPGQLSSLHHDFENEPANAQNGPGQSTEEPGPGSTRGGHKRSTFTRVRLIIGAIVNDNRCQFFIVLLIIVNAIMMGIGTFDFVTEDPHISDVFEKVDRSFLIIFTVELVMQFIYHGLNLFRDGWLVFDFIIIVFSWVFESIQIIRAFRIFRAFRLVTRIETLRNLISSLFAVFPNLSAIACFLLLIFYIFAVMFTTLYSDLELSDDYFTNLGTTLFTLFQYMTMEWSEVTREVMLYQSWAWLPSVVFVAISGFIVFNLIIAVICDAVAIIEQEKNDDDSGTGRGDEDVNIDEASQKRIYELSRQMMGLVQTQREMQLQIEHLAKEYYALQGIPAPTDTDVDGDDDADTYT